jgi:hypothetical protein
MKSPDKTFFGLVLLAFTTCEKRQLKTDVELSKLLRNPSLTLNEAIAFETKINSQDNSYDHYIASGEGLYPNERHYNLTTVKTYLRGESDIDCVVNYHSTADDSVRVILYEWKPKILLYRGATLLLSRTMQIVFKGWMTNSLIWRARLHLS